jgi:type IV fimbrial biogenesis protein FimT
VNTRRQRGFNLIEIAVVLALIAAVMLLAMPMYSNWLQNSQLRASAESIMAGLNQARSEAVRGNTTTGVRFSLTAGNAWNVTRVSDGVQILEGGGLDLAKNAVVTPNPAGVTDVTFSPLGQTNPAVTVDIDVTHADAARKCVVDGGEMRCLRVQVRSGGLIRLCDTNPSIPAGDPRRCLP